MLVLFAVLGLAALAYSAMSSKGEGGSGLISGATVGAHATSVVAQAHAIQDGYMLAAINGVAAAAVTLDASAGVGLMNPSVGGMQSLVPDGNVLIAGASTDPADGWMEAQLLMPGMGTTAGYETVVLLFFVRPDVCLAVQKMGKGPSVVAVPTATIFPDLTAGVGFSGQMLGCFNIGGAYTIFVVVDSL